MNDRVKIEVVVREMVREFASNLRVCLPGKIVSYDADTHLASVQPLIKRRFNGAEQAVDLPIVNRVPVVHPRTATSLIRLPVASGDIVTMVFADRSLEQWVAGDGESKDPLDVRMHHISDAYAILGGYPEGQPFTAANPDALEIVVQDGTAITIGNGTDDLLQAASDAFEKLQELCDSLSDTLAQIQILTVSGVTTGPGVSGVPVNAAAFVAIDTTVQGISTEVQSIRDSLENLLP